MRRRAENAKEVRERKAEEKRVKREGRKGPFVTTIKDVLKRGEVLDSWTESVDNRPEWRKLTHEVCNGIDEKRRVNNERMREKRHQKR